MSFAEGFTKGSAKTLSDLKNVGYITGASARNSISEGFKNSDLWLEDMGLDLSKIGAGIVFTLADSDIFDNSDNVHFEDVGEAMKSALADNKLDNVDWKNISDVFVSTYWHEKTPAAENFDIKPQTKNTDDLENVNYDKPLAPESYDLLDFSTLDTNVSDISTSVKSVSTDIGDIKTGISNLAAGFSDFVTAVADMDASNGIRADDIIKAISDAHFIVDAARLTNIMANPINRGIGRLIIQKSRGGSSV